MIGDAGNGRSSGVVCLCLCGPPGCRCALGLPALPARSTRSARADAVRCRVGFSPLARSNAPRVQGKTLAYVLFYEPGGTRRLPVSAAGVLCGRRDRPTGDPKRPDTTPEPACVPGTVYCIGNCVTVRLFGRSCGNTSSRTGASDNGHGAPRRRSVACRVLQSRCVPWRSTR